MCGVAKFNVQMKGKVCALNAFFPPHFVSLVFFSFFVWWIFSFVGVDPYFSFYNSPLESKDKNIY